MVAVTCRIYREPGTLGATGVVPGVRSQMAVRAEGGGKSPERRVMHPGIHLEPLPGSGRPRLLGAWLLDPLLPKNRGGPDAREKPVRGTHCPKTMAWTWQHSSRVWRLLWGSQGWA